MILRTASSQAEAQRLRDLARLRGVRDRMDREFAQPLDVEALGCSSLGTFSTRFAELVGMPPSAYRSQAARVTAGMPPCMAKHVTRPVRNREARVPDLQLA